MMRTHIQIVWAVSVGLLVAPIAAAQPPSTASSTTLDTTSKPTDERTEARLVDQQPGTKGVDEGLFPKSIKIPGTDVSLSVGGYVKVDFIQDFSAISDAFEFRTNSIPARGTAAAAQSGQTTIHARETRINLDLRSSAARLPFRAFVEGDFFGSGNAFRLRHGYGEFGRLLGGQTWTTFMDISARPLTLDFEGPDGEIFVRQAMLRWTQPLAEGWTLAAAVENPTPQFAIPSDVSGSARSNMPDIPAYVRYAASRGHVQVAGMVRQLRFDGGQGFSNESTLGWGLNATFSVKAVGQDQLQGQFMIGQGVARYIEALAGQNVDAVLTADGDLDAIRSQGGLVGYTRHWRPHLRSGFAYSTASVEDHAGLGGSVIERTQDFRVSLIHTPYSLIDIGGELLWGRRDNQDGTHGDAWRFQFAVIYRLN